MAIILSLCFRLKVATPSSNSISPYLPFIFLFERVTVYVKSFVVSASFPETLFIIFKSPTETLSYINSHDKWVLFT